jgi:integrase
VGKRFGNRLNSQDVRKLGPGRHADGGGLYLFVKPSGTRSWMMRTTVQGKRRDIGLGPTHIVTLGEARAEAQRIRKLVFLGQDPLVARREADQMPTFAEAADEVWRGRKATFRNAKHSAQWITTLQTYAYSHFGARKIGSVTSAHVLKALTPIWHEKPETASRVMGRIREVFRWAKAAGHYGGDNPVDDAKTALGRQNAKPQHHAALPWPSVPDFFAQLGERKAVSALTLQFLILTASRSGEARGARWEEIDAASKVWTVPPERMKAGREHRVPLTDAALAVLKEAGFGELRKAGLIFPNSKGGEQSDMVFKALFTRMEFEGFTAHGFRSSFRDWCSEQTSFPREVAEAALAHVVGDATERAYARSDLFERRRKLMNEWAKFANSKA